MEKSFKFTSARMAGLTIPPGETDFAYYDTAARGFGVRFQGEGRGTYFIKYKLGKKYRRVQLGRVGEVALLAAQKAAESIRTQVRVDKIDPATERAKAMVSASLTFNPAFDGYLEKLESERSPRYAAQAAGFLKIHFKKLHDIALSEIEQANVSAVLKTIRDTRGPIAMNRARSTGSAFFNWAWREGLCKHNPFKMTNVNEEAGSGRERTLTDRELKTIWHKAPATAYGDIVKLLMLTACRRTEIGGLKFSEINWRERLIELPAKTRIDGKWIQRTKNGWAHAVPLSAPALKILEARRGMIGHNSNVDFVFGHRDSEFSGWSKAKSDLDKIVKVPNWGLHDLRRTADTALPGLAKVDGGAMIAPHIIDAVMNHISTDTSAKKGIRKKYNKYDFLDEKRDALDRYAAHLMKIVNG